MKTRKAEYQETKKNCVQAMNLSYERGYKADHFFLVLILPWDFLVLVVNKCIKNTINNKSIKSNMKFHIFRYVCLV